MRFSHALAVAPLLSAVVAFVPASTSGTDKLAEEGLSNLAKYEVRNHSAPVCNTTTGYVRKEWSALTSSQKTAYINAVLCLQSKPAKTAPSVAPGAKTRYDDFVAVHINQTLTIHGTVQTVPSL